MKRLIAAAAIVGALLGLSACNPITGRGTCPGPIASCVRW